MIKYRLNCKNCKLSFDSWFASSKEYEKLKKKNYLNCHNCGSKKIEKTLMAPKVINKSKFDNLNQNFSKFNKIEKKIREYQKFIKKNFDYVGKNFAYEARSIHYNQKKKDKGIYGTASRQEIKELREEGIGAEIIPWIEDKKN
ncbi:DUF1178 family protein [Candidatus Pelagibacter sp.]|nr:DUF1178 family protein [Candidatus Pelagibacter sp.]